MPTSIAAVADGLELNTFDVIIVGGGAAGIGAAIGARQAAPGARILVIESQSSLGGAATHRGVVSYCGLFTVEDKPRRAVGAVWEELKRRLLEVGRTTERPVRHRGKFQVKLFHCRDSPNSRCLLLFFFQHRWWNLNASN
jgi:flavin-dependent dehydrogenase